MTGRSTPAARYSASRAATRPTSPHATNPSATGCGTSPAAPGMRLIKTINLPGGAGQHFFFDMGGGNALAFFWFPDAPDPVPGISAPVTVPGLGEWTSAVGSMNHVAFNVPEERFLEYRAKLKAKGVRVSPILDHDDSEMGVAREFHPGVDRKSTRLNSSHVEISYAVFCLKKKK